VDAPTSPVSLVFVPGGQRARIRRFVEAAVAAVG
jgi:hypothetical protein